jgi:NAD(P)-dependent dehydrogenase (short-subunit alcohol dehydrogenase family)
MNPNKIVLVTGANWGIGLEICRQLVEEGADTAVWLAQLPDNGPNGKFFRDRKEISW